MVKRYAEDYCAEKMEECRFGDWVAFDDYASLLTQVKSLEVYPGRCERLEIENAALRHRLKKLEEGK